MKPTARRSLALLLAVVMMFSFLNMPTYASSAQDQTLALSLKGEWNTQKTIYTVSVVTSGNNTTEYKITSGQLVVGFDSNVVTYKDVVQGNIVIPKDPNDEYSTEQPLRFSAATTLPANQNFVIAAVSGTTQFTWTGEKILCRIRFTPKTDIEKTNIHCRQLKATQVF